jgi:hypothetical protein
MRTFLVILILFSHVVLAQDSVAQKKIKLLERGFSGRNSVMSALDSLKRARLDSIKMLNKLREAQRKVDSLRNQAANKVTDINAKLDSVTNLANARLDSLKRKTVGGVLDAQNTIESKINSGEEKLGSLQNKLSDKTNDLTKIDLPANGESKEITNALGLDKVQIPELKTELLNVNIPTLDIPEVKVPDLDVNIPQVNANLPQKDLPIDKKPDLEVGIGNNIKLPNIENPVESVTEKVKDVKVIAGEAGQYVQDAKELNEKGISGMDTKHLEKQAFELTGASEADKKLAEFNKLKVEQQQIMHKFQDKKLVQAELKRKMKNVVNDQINLDNPAIKKAQEQFGKTMAIAEKAKDAKGIIGSKQVNEWKGKPLRERLIPGLGFQISRNTVFSLDLDPQMGYRLNNRFIVGLGGHYRLNISKQYNSIVQEGGVYGGRAYVDFKAIKSFYIHAEFEGLTLNKDIVPTLSEKDIPVVYSSHFGLGKQFNVSKRISATMYGFYRLEYSGHLPGFNKYNTRLVFGLRPKKAKAPIEPK